MSTTTRMMLEGLINVMLWIIAWEPAPSPPNLVADVEALREKLKASGDPLIAAKDANSQS
jgi:hypothetical protein